MRCSTGTVPLECTHPLSPLTSQCPHCHVGCLHGVGGYPHLGFIPVGIGAVSFPGAGRGAELMGSIVLSHGRVQQLPQGAA